MVHVSLQVSKYFTEIFKRLVPQGHAVLVMKRGDLDGEVGPSDDVFYIGRYFDLAGNYISFPVCRKLTQMMHKRETIFPSKAASFILILLVVNKVDVLWSTG